jgi:hypothetical protein
MKHGGVALPEVVIGDSLPVAVGGCWEVGALEGGGGGKKRLYQTDGRDGTQGSHRCQR